MHSGITWQQICFNESYVLKNHTYDANFVCVYINHCITIKMGSIHKMYFRSFYTLNLIDILPGYFANTEVIHII